MADAKGRESWAHTSSLLAMLANVNRDPRKTRAFKPADFDPHAKEEKVIKVGKKGLGILKQVFVDRPKRKGI